MKKNFAVTAVLLTIRQLLVSCGVSPYNCIDQLGCLGISSGSSVV
jgi:hypothetical protein